MVRRLWVGNCDSEYMVHRRGLLDTAEHEGTPAVGARMVWLLRDGDALVLPQPVDPVHLKAIGSLMGFDPARVHILTPEDAAVRCLDQRQLHGPGLLARLRALVQRPEEWQVRGYLHDRGLGSLARALGITGYAPFEEAGGAELFNSKAVFGALAAGAGVRVPDGALCATRGDLLRAVPRLLKATGAVIVKADRHAGGAGNWLCRTDADMPAAGALQTLDLTGPDRLDALVAATGLEEMHAPHGQFVAEVYHPHCRSLCVEIDCDPAGSTQPAVLNVGEMLMEPVWNGFLMPAPLAPAPQQTILEGALRLAAAMRDFGYRGLVNIDAIVTPAGEVFFNEVNARLGGCTHLHRLATHLLGPHWMRTHTLRARNDLPATTLPRLLDDLHTHQLAWNPHAGEGVVITTDRTALHRSVEYAVLAPTPERAAHLEDRLRTLQAGRSRPPRV